MCGIFLLAQKKPDRRAALEAFYQIKHRGPDQSVFLEMQFNDWTVFLGFHRLAIMDPINGTQPFISEGAYLICNGEIYNSPRLRYQESYWAYRSRSDCEVLIPLYQRGGIETIWREVEGEYAIVVADLKLGTISLGTDHLRTRPLFTVVGEGVFGAASEAKALARIEGSLSPFPAGTATFDLHTGEFKATARPLVPTPFADPPNPAMAATRIRELFIAEVRRRMLSDAPVVYLLSGGLDSSLCAAVAAAAAHPSRIRTFTFSFEGEGPDLLAAREVAKHIDSVHTEIILSIEEGLTAIPDVVRALESTCLTTVRAATPQYLLCREIRRRHPEVKVVVSGETADELFGGYEYFKNAPTPEEGRLECLARLNEIYLYDALRADRVTAHFGFELRTPFQGRPLVNYVLSLPPDYTKVETLEKQILRDALGDFLPATIARRSKMGMSDAVGLSWVDAVREWAAKKGGEKKLYEELYARDFKTALVPRDWMPRRDWYNYEIADPSARFIHTFTHRK